MRKVVAAVASSLYVYGKSDEVKVIKVKKKKTGMATDARIALRLMYVYV